MFCTKCGAQNADGAGFCSSCGAPLQPSQAGNNSQGGDQEKKIVIKSPSYGRTGLVLSIFSMVCVAISPVGLLFGPPGMLLTGAAAIILALLLIILWAGSDLLW